MQKPLYYTGIDAGSTTLKIVLLDSGRRVIHSSYERHHTLLHKTLHDTLKKIFDRYGDFPMALLCTGSAGLGIAESYSIPFVQEMIASVAFCDRYYPDVKTFIDIGGEDSKLILLEKQAPDMRMNGNCAGGTGAFLDQMGVLLNKSLEELDGLASQAGAVFPIASRCGVFAKTDVQNLLAQHARKEDIAASIFHAVALQAASALLRGTAIKPGVLFAGGPLTFLPQLRKALSEVLGIEKTDVLVPEHSVLIPALGAGLKAMESKEPVMLSHLIGHLHDSRLSQSFKTTTLKPLFSSPAEYAAWEKKKAEAVIPQAELTEIGSGRTFLGIDSGSTTTKIILIDDAGRVLFRYYAPNLGNSLLAVKLGLLALAEKSVILKAPLEIALSGVTGYGEDLIRAALGLDEGIVETMAHVRAARFFAPKVSFILDIGGQDMKAIFVSDGIVQNIAINEACSSGCGTFIETFAQGLGLSVEEFAAKSVSSARPYDLGTRCTVFMNSKIKQCQREGVSLQDISAGLSYSVVKNCLNKVLKIKDKSFLGDEIVVQGGAFKNPGVARALEIVLGTEVKRPELSEYMGAYGCALKARDSFHENPERQSAFIGLERAGQIDQYEKNTIRCKGCENTCEISVLQFQNSGRYYTGNRCERVFQNAGAKGKSGVNLYAMKYKLLFERNCTAKGKLMGKIGIPRILNIYEDFPFWCALFTEAGFDVTLSSASKDSHLELGAGSIMSENVCFPAKLAHGHIAELVHKGVKRIFYPLVRFEKSSFPGAGNSFNCPVVAGYPEVIRASVRPQDSIVSFDTPMVSLKDEKLLRKSLRAYFGSLGVSAKCFSAAFKKALAAQRIFKEKILQEGRKICEAARRDGRSVIVLAGRPYHLDPLINHHVPEIIASFGVDVLTEDALPSVKKNLAQEVAVLSQWEYPNRLYNAAHWTGRSSSAFLVQLNSFGCGLDAVSIDEVAAILETYHRVPTVIRIDEMTGSGSIRLRIRSLVESIGALAQIPAETNPVRIATPLFQKKDRRKTIIAPTFSPFINLLMEGYIRSMGYKLEVLAEPDRESVEIGMRYVNNEICFPAIICIGDILKALQSGRYDLGNTAAMISETGGQCRASNYACLLKKALIKAGFAEVPVIAMSVNSQSQNRQPGFKVNWPRFLKTGLEGLLYSDALLKLYYKSRVRESTPGTSLALLDICLKRFATESLAGKQKALVLLEKAIGEFNLIEWKNESSSVPRVGIVGEIYVKYNPFSNNRITEFLMERGVEPVVPPLVSFFLQFFVNREFSHQSLLKKTPWYMRALISLGEAWVNKVRYDYNSALSGFRIPIEPLPDIRDLARSAAKVTTLFHQYGEGWLLAGDIAQMAEEGVKEVVCLQPFGCIANHVIAKGLSAELKRVFPGLKLLFLDMDADSSPVNLTNRLEYLIANQ